MILEQRERVNNKAKASMLIHQLNQQKKKANEFEEPGSALRQLSAEEAYAGHDAKLAALKKELLEMEADPDEDEAQQLEGEEEETVDVDEEAEPREEDEAPGDGDGHHEPGAAEGDTPADDGENPPEKGKQKGNKGKWGQKPWWAKQNRPGVPSRTGLGRKAAKRVDGKGRARGSSTTMAESIAMAGTEQSMATSTRTSAFLVGLDVMWFAMKRISNSVKPILIIPNQFLLFSQLHNLSTHHTHIDSRCASHLDSALHPFLNSLHHV